MTRRVASAAATGAVQVGADGGEGTDTATYNGTAGDDVIGIARNGTTTVAAFATDAPTMNVAAVESLLVKGGDGNDTLAGQNGIGTLTSLTLDGGNGDDSVRGGDGADTLLGGSATTSWTATSAPTRRTAAPATTTCSGIRATARTWSRATAAPTRWTSTAPTSARRSRCWPTARA